MSNTGYDDGQTSPEEVFGRVYPSSDVIGDNPSVLGADHGADDVSSLPAGQDSDPDDL